MPPQKSLKPLTNDEIFKLKLQQEQEMSRLQRHYVSLEQDRHQFTGGLKLMQLNEILAIFRQEHANILTDLRVATCSTRKKEDIKVSENLQMLLHEHDFFTNQAGTEKQFIKEIDDQIHMVQRDVVKLRSQQITDRQHEERVWLARKTVEALDNKLEVQMQKFGTTCAELNQLKLKIKSFLCERQVFLKMWGKMIDKLVLGKRFLLDLIEQATIAYDQREEWCSKLQALRLKAHQDFLLHTEHMTELERKQNNTEKLELFFGIKGQKRIMRDLFIKEEQKRHELRKKLQEKKENYKYLIDEILEFTKENKVGVIAKKFYNQEANNLSKFNYINDLIREMEGINDKLGKFYMEVEEQRYLHNVRVKTQQQVLEQLELELEEAKNSYQSSEKEVTKSEEHFNIVLTEIDKLFKICQCNNDVILQLLGDQQTINKHNALLYLEMIERKIHQVLVETYYKNKVLFEKKKIPFTSRVITEEKFFPTIYSLDRLVASSPCPLCFETEMVSDVIDSVQEVISREEAKKRLKVRLKIEVDQTVKIHNVSDCHLPKSREIMQKRYQ